MGAPIEIALDVSQAVAYVGEKRDLIAEVLGNRIDVVNSMMAERIRANLTGQVLAARSGKLLGTVDWTPASSSGTEVVGDVHAGGSEAPYGIFHEKGGTQRYLIFPSGDTNARVLSFMMGGKRIFAKYVDHPPIQKRPWFEPVTSRAEAEMYEQLQEGANEVLADGQ